MAEAKTKVTLVGTVLAKQGVEFIYEGEVAGCDTCKVKKACNNLQPGRKYRIISVRTTHHDCVVHLNGTTAVEVIDAPDYPHSAPTVLAHATRTGPMPMGGLVCSP